MWARAGLLFLEEQNSENCVHTLHIHGSSNSSHIMHIYRETSLLCSGKPFSCATFLFVCVPTFPRMIAKTLPIPIEEVRAMCIL